jgi:hypothetical protein
MRKKLEKKEIMEFVSCIKRSIGRSKEEKEIKRGKYLC